MISINACETTSGGLSIGWEPDSEISHTHDTKKNGKSGPPPYAPAHGYRAKHTYHYYPDAQVYFDISKKTYFYMKCQSWQVSASLPSGLNVQLGDYVTNQMDSDKPYTRFKNHKKKYPPGQRKRKINGPGKSTEEVYTDKGITIFDSAFFHIHSNTGKRSQKKI